MKPVQFRMFLAFIALLAVVANPLVAPAALYQDSNKDLKSGDIADQDYWFAKFDNMMLDLAIQQKQPEGHIGVCLASSINRLNELVKKYPKHEDIAKWKSHADEINAKIDPNANRSTPFNANCPWEEANFAQLWVNFHYGKMLYEAKDYNTALLMFQNVMQNYDIMLKADRMKEYPEDLRKWVMDHKAEADEIYAGIKKHTSR